MTPIERVTLRGGFTVPLPSLWLLWDLEARGFSLLVDAAGLIVRPRARIAPTDDHAIRQHRDALIALARYCATDAGLPLSDKEHNRR